MLCQPPPPALYVLLFALFGIIADVVSLPCNRLVCERAGQTVYMYIYIYLCIFAIVRITKEATRSYCIQGVNLVFFLLRHYLEIVLEKQLSEILFRLCIELYLIPIII